MAPSAARRGLLLCLIGLSSSPGCINWQELFGTEDEPPGGRPPQPFEMTVRVAADAPIPADDAPPTAGWLPRDVPDEVRVYDLGLLAITAGHSADIELDVGGGVGGVQVLVYGHEGTRVILESVLSPAGVPVVSDQDPDDLPPSHLSFARGFPAQAFSLNRALGSPQLGAFLLPNTTSVGIGAGLHRLRVGQYAVDVLAQPPTRAPVDRPVRVFVLARPTRPQQGEVKLALHLTGGGGLTAATAPTDAFLQEALEVVRLAWAAVDIQIADVTYVDVDPLLRTIQLAEDECDGGQLDALFAAGAGGDGAALPLFVIERFGCVFGGTELGDDIGGLSGGIPGPAFVRGAPHAGVAVATGFAEGEAVLLGVVMAHELSHYLGLFHNRESGFFGANPIFDEISDTAEDMPAAGENLMYFGADTSVELSQGQGRVLRGSPWVMPTD